MSVLNLLLRFFRWLWCALTGRPSVVRTPIRLIRFCRVPFARKRGEQGTTAQLVRVCTPSEGETVNGTTVVVEGQIKPPDTDVTVTLDGVPGITTLDPPDNPTTFKTTFTGVSPGADKKVEAVGNSGCKDTVTITVTASTGTDQAAKTPHEGAVRVCLGSSETDPTCPALRLLAKRVELPATTVPGVVGLSLEFRDAKSASFEIGFILPDKNDAPDDSRLGDRRTAATFDGEAWVASFDGVQSGTHTFRVTSKRGAEDSLVIDVCVTG